jgi:hypothetical protein
MLETAIEIGSLPGAPDDAALRTTDGAAHMRACAGTGMGSSEDEMSRATGRDVVRERVCPATCAALNAMKIEESAQRMNRRQAMLRAGKRGNRLSRVITGELAKGIRRTKSLKGPGESYLLPRDRQGQPVVYQEQRLTKTLNISNPFHFKDVTEILQPPDAIRL